MINVDFGNLEHKETKLTVEGISVLTIWGSLNSIPNDFLLVCLLLAGEEDVRGPGSVMYAEQFGKRA
jgi:hypothetical protein